MTYQKNQTLRNMLWTTGIVIVSAIAAAGQATAPTAEPTNYQPPPTMDPTVMPPYSYAGVGLRERPDVQEDPATIAQQYSCLIQIDGATSIAQPGWPANGYTTSNTFGVAPDSHFAAALVSSTAAIDAVAVALRITPQQRQEQVRVHATAIGLQLLRLEVDIEKGPNAFAAGDAQKLAEKLCDQLTQAFKQSADARNKSTQLQADQNEKDLSAMQKQLADVRAKLLADSQQTSTITPMYGDVSSTLVNARNQRQSAIAELERNRTRLATIEPPASSTLESEWEGLVSQYQQQLQDLTAARAAGNATDAQVKQVQGKLSDAQLHLATAKLQSDSSNDPNRNYRNQEASGLKATIADQESRLKQYDQTIAQLTDPSFLKALDEQRALQTLEQNLVGRVAELQSRITLVTATTDTSPAVTLTILGR